MFEAFYLWPSSSSQYLQTFLSEALYLKPSVTGALYQTGPLSDGPSIRGTLHQLPHLHQLPYFRQHFERERECPGAPNRPREPQNGFGRPKTDGTKSAVFSAETRGSKCPVGSGRVATETGIRKRAPSKRAQEKIRRSGTPHPSLRQVHIRILIHIDTNTPRRSG